MQIYKMYFHFQELNENQWMQVNRAFLWTFSIFLHWDQDQNEPEKEDFPYVFVFVLLTIWMNLRQKIAPLYVHKIFYKIEIIIFSRVYPIYRGPSTIKVSAQKKKATSMLKILVLRIRYHIL